MKPIGNIGQKIVLKLDNFPKLAKALRDGDLPTARVLCARLFEIDSGAQTLPDASGALLEEGRRAVN